MKWDVSLFDQNMSAWFAVDLQGTELKGLWVYLIMVRVLAVNGSARMGKGYTAKVLAPFLDGMRDAGAFVESVYARSLKLEPCRGDLFCWYEKPGKCYLYDDMQILYPKLREADVLVLATPVYMPLPGEMQNFLNRLVCLIQPDLVWQGGRTRARFRDDVKIKKIVLVGVCGWFEFFNFGTVVRIARELAKNVGVEFAAPVLRPHAYHLDKDNDKTRAVMEALRKAGSELVKSGDVSKELLDLVGQPLISEEEYKKGLRVE